MYSIEIYKLKQTIGSEQRRRIIDGYLYHAAETSAKNYAKEWSGDIDLPNKDALPARIMLEPPKGYKGGELRYGDIAVIDCVANFVDPSGVHVMSELPFGAFDSALAKPEIHVEYDRLTNIDGAVCVSRELNAICNMLLIPVGYAYDLAETTGGSGLSAKLSQKPRYDGAACYLHPDFLSGREAEAFTALLWELALSERWPAIQDCLFDDCPVNMADLEAARERFAPELLLPVEIRHLYGVLPTNADAGELNYLAARLRGLSEDEREVFGAVIEAGWHSGSIAEMINITESLGSFEFHPEEDAKQFGEGALEADRTGGEAVFNELIGSDDRERRIYAAYVLGLEESVDVEAYGRAAARDEGGVFTSYGYIAELGEPFREAYRGVQDLPVEYRAMSADAPVPVQYTGALIKLEGVDLAALLLEMRALGGEFMRTEKRDIAVLAQSDAEDFIVVYDPARHSIDVLPALDIYQRGTGDDRLLLRLDGNSDIKVYAFAVTSRGEGKIIGNVYEFDIDGLQEYVREPGANCTRVDDEVKAGGTNRVMPPVEYRVMPPGEYRVMGEAVSAVEFLAELSAPYMSAASNPCPDMLRVTLDAAAAILATDSAPVYRLFLYGVEKLSPIDAVRSRLNYSGFREFAVKPEDIGGVERWAARAAGEMLGQIQRENERGQSRDWHGEHNKSNHKGDEAL